MTKEKAQARREQLARMRAEQQRKERRTAFLMWGAGGLVIVVLIGLVAFYIISDRAERSLEGVKSFNYKGAGHTYDKVAYKETPPVGGQHNYYWQNCGIHDKPIHNEHAVHSMEHGAVWITYRPDLPAAEVNKLKDLASADYMLLSPYPGLPSKIVASSWNNQLTFDSADDPRLQSYIQKYKQNPTYTPEPGAACDGGVGTSSDDPLPPTPAPSAVPSTMQSAEPSAAPSPTSS
jgi:hypothetical protein